MTRYARNDGYIGLARQSAKGTGVAPTHFLKWSGAASMTPQQDFQRLNEGGDSQYPGITIKQLHKPDGSFSLFARPKAAALLFGLLLGKQVSTGAAKSGGASTTLASRLEKGLKYLHVAATTDFAIGDVVQVGASDEEELRTISAVHTAAASGSTTLTGAHAAGTTDLTVGDSTNFVQDDYLTIGSGATLEVHKVASVADGTHITLVDGLVNAQSDGATITEVTNILEVSAAVVRAHAAAAAVVEKQTPYTHVFTPCDPVYMPWASLERSLGALLVNRFTDVRIKQIEVSGEAGQPVTLAVSYLGIDEERQTSAQTATFETEDPWIFWQGTYTVDGTDLTAKVTSFRLRLINVFDEVDQTDDIIRADALLIRRDVEVQWEMKFDAISRYAETYLGSATGTDPASDIKESSGTLSIDLSYSSGADLRQLKVEIPNVYHTVASVELDANATESQAYACEGHARKVSGAELVEVTIQNGEVARYTDA